MIIVNDKEKPWEKRKESLKTRIWFFIGGSLATFLLVFILYLTDIHSRVYLITLLVIVGLIICSAIIILIVIFIHKIREKKEK